MSESMFVHFRDAAVGQITLATSGLIEFRYGTEWQQNPDRFPISISLPLDGNFDVHASHHFFVNLLPEATIRQQICQSLQISQGNDFGLLKAIGGDCAGALAIYRWLRRSSLNSVTKLSVNANWPTGPSAHPTHFRQ